MATTVPTETTPITTAETNLQLITTEEATRTPVITEATSETIVTSVTAAETAEVTAAATTPLIQRPRHGHKDGTAKPRRRRRRGECGRHENGGAVGADPLPAD